VARFVPFKGSYVRPDFVRRVPAPAFDSMSGDERREYLSTHPESYTLVTRSPGDGGPEDDATPQRLIELGAEALQRIVDADAFEQVDRDAFFLYRLTRDGHSQVGVVGLVATSDYLDGTVKRHEQVRESRALHLSNHFEQLGVHSSPIAIGYRRERAMRERLDAILAASEPVLSFTSGDALEQAVWVVDDPDDCAAITAALSSHDLYIMDGHHRAAAAGALAERLPGPRSEFMLCVLFADDRVRIEPFHRQVLVADDVDLHSVHDRLRTVLGLELDPRLATELPEEPGQLGVYMDGQWWLGVMPRPATESPLDAIDPVRLQELVIGPILGVDPERAKGAMRYFLESADRAKLAATIGDREILFVLRAVTPGEVFAVADDGLNMPPKSTYVTPKPRSGVFLRRF